MKLTRRQLRHLIFEVVVASDDAKKAAADLEQNLRDDNPDASDEEIEAAVDKITESKAASGEIPIKRVDHAIISCLKK